MKDVSKQTQLQHLYWRAGFGETAAVVEENAKKPLRKVVRQLLKNSEDFQPLKVLDENLIARREIKDMRGELTRDEIKDLLKEQISKIRDINVAWIDNMATTKAVLREKMTLFWHGHFACRVRNPQAVQNQNNILRQHALGKFGDLLMAVSKDPGMLQFLNNQQNNKRSPNENFAREVLELFTLGRGNYSEADIKNAARAFTGWGFNLRGEFVFRENQHDFDSKTFFGKTGNFNGEDIINIILEKEQTARFIVSKIYKHFVNEVPDNQIIDNLTKRFHHSHYDIADLMEEIFTSDWFYDPKNIGSHLKSPIELLAGMKRGFGMNFDEKQSLLYVQRVLGQVLFYPPNVAGWAGGKTWIDSSSLLFRMKMPEVVFNSGVVNFNPKDDGDVNSELLNRRVGKMLRATVDWSSLEKTYSGLKDSELCEQLAGYLLQVPITDEQKKLVLRRASNAPNGNLLKNLSISLMSLPEYQLC